MIERQLAKLQNALIEGRIDKTAYDRLKADLYDAAGIAPNGQDADPSEGEEESSDLQEGRDYIDDEEFEKAIAFFDERISDRPDFADAYCFRGVAHRFLDRLDEAMADQEEALRIEPAHALALMEKSLVHFGQNDPGEGFRSLDELASVRPNDPETFFGRAEAHRHMGQNAKAIEDYNRSIILDSHFVDAYIGRGEALNALEKFDKATGDFNKADYLQPKYPYAICMRGWSFYHRGEFANAIADFNQVLHLEPDNPHAHYGRGCATQQRAALSSDKRMFEMAMSDFEQAHNLDPSLTIPNTTLEEAESQISTNHSDVDWEAVGKVALKVAKWGAIAAGIAGMAILTVAASSMEAGGSGTGGTGLKRGQRPCPKCGHGYTGMRVRSQGTCVSCSALLPSW
jgi:tetratricopeptide (TPR) repeat protein